MLQIKKKNDKNSHVICRLTYQDRVQDIKLMIFTYIQKFFDNKRKNNIWLI